MIVLKQKLRIHPDVIISGIAILFSAVLMFEIKDYPKDVRLFPMVFLLFFVLFMAIVLVRGIKKSVDKNKNAEAVPESEWWCKLETIRNPLITAAFIVVYVALIGIVGFYIASVLYMCSAMYYFGSKKILLNLAISIGTMVFVYALITWQLSVSLPMGLIFEAIFG